METSMQISMQMQQTQTLSKMWATTQNHNCCHDALLENTTAHLFFLFHWKIIILCSVHHTPIKLQYKQRETVDKKILGWAAYFQIKKNKEYVYFGKYYYLYLWQLAVI